VLAMAASDETTKNSNDNPVSVDPDAIAAHGRTLGELAGRIHNLELLTGVVKISPGAFPTAKMLMKKFNTNTAQLNGSITNYGKLFDQVGDQFISLSKVYHDAKDLNKDDADRLNGVVSAVTSTFNNTGSTTDTTDTNSTDSQPPPDNGDNGDDKKYKPQPWHDGAPDANAPAGGHPTVPDHPTQADIDHDKNPPQGRSSAL